MKTLRYKRKSYFINKKLQIRYLLTLIIPLIIIMVFIGAVMFYSSRAILYSTVDKISGDMGDIIKSKNSVMHESKSETEKNSLVIEEIRKKLNSYKTDKQVFSKNLLKKANILLLWGLLLVLLELAVLSIFVSHKIAGPIYRFEKFAEEVSNGNLTGKIILRQGDELTQIAEKFNSMLTKIRERLKKIRDCSQDLATSCKQNQGQIPADQMKQLQQISTQIQDELDHLIL